MKVVLDTNVLMSGIFFAGPPARILTAWAEDQLDLLATVDILAEYRRVGSRLRKKYPSVDVDPVLDLVIRESRIVEPVPVEADACSDKDDLKFLACALAGNADCVVSGDRALLRASGYEGIEVMTPRDFQTRFLEK
ncbi:MAG: putative toxin-antitoxin system toxin component, PIN family [Polyangiales bacterium]